MPCGQWRLSIFARVEVLVQCPSGSTAKGDAVARAKGRGRGGGGDDGNGPSGPRRPRGGGGHGRARSVTEAQDTAAQEIKLGRPPGAARNAQPGHQPRPPRPPRPGSQQGAEALLTRAQELRLRGGTTAVVRVRSRRPDADGNYREEVWVASSRSEAPSEWKVPGEGPDASRGERYIPSRGTRKKPTHAEEDIIAELGDDWEIVEGATNVNICKDKCLPLLENVPGLKVSGQPRRTNNDDYSPWRTFWKEE
jgi:hypothetical protein